MNKARSLLASMLKIGCIGFGGGSALIPVIEEEVVQEQKLISQEGYDKAVVVASITPGALPVEIATGLGQEYGRKNMVFAAIAMAFPGAFLTVLLLSVLSGSSRAVIQQIEIAALGITPFILYLLTDYVWRVGSEAKKESTGRMWKVILIFCSVFLLSGGKNLYLLLGIKGQPLFVLSTVSVLGIACFFVVWTHGNYHLTNLIVPGILIITYLICEVRNQGFFGARLKLVITILMVVLTVWRGYQSFSSGKSNQGTVSWCSLVKELIAWILLVVVFALPSFFLVDQTGNYLAKGTFSSLLSFGGGDAYLTVADGMFVSTEMVSSSDFYGSLVSIANVLPGSILCKILTGIGYFIGYQEGQSVITGYIVAMAGFLCSVAASGGVYCIVAFLYQCFEKIDIFQSLRRWIRPIIAGLLLNVMISLLNQSLATGVSLGMENVTIMILMVVLYGINLFFARVVKAGNMSLIVISLVIAMLSGNIILL